MTPLVWNAQNRQVCGDGKQINGCSGLKGTEGLATGLDKGSVGFLLGVMKCSKVDRGDGCTVMWTVLKTRLPEIKSSYGNKVGDDVGRAEWGEMVEAEQLRRLDFLRQVKSHGNTQDWRTLGKDQSVCALCWVIRLRQAKCARWEEREQIE